MADVDILTTLKILIIGESGVGKSRWEIREIWAWRKNFNYFFFLGSSYSLFFLVSVDMYVMFPWWFRRFQVYFVVKRWFAVEKQGSKEARSHTLIVCLSLFWVTFTLYVFLSFFSFLVDFPYKFESRGKKWMKYKLLCLWNAFHFVHMWIISLFFPFIKFASCILQWYCTL